MRGRLFERDMYPENFYDQSAQGAKPKSPLFRTI